MLRMEKLIRLIPICRQTIINKTLDVFAVYTSITSSAPNYCIAPVFPALFSDGRPTLSNLSKIQCNIKRFFLN